VQNPSGGGRALLIRDFLRDRRGNYALMTGLAMLPIMGGLALAVDFTEMNRQQRSMRNALDAAGVAVARQIVTGATEAELTAYANDFFRANLSDVAPADVELSVMLPSNAAGGGTLKLQAKLNYKPYFFPAFEALLGKAADQRSGTMDVSARTEIRLKNTLEVALVLDNSGSMNEYGSDSGQRRIDLLKAAAKQLVDTLSAQAKLIKQVDKPVQFALVPFAASVNVGPANAGASWMDAEGLSPIHHENFTWATLTAADKYAQQTNGIWYKRGAGWGDNRDTPLTRFSLYADMKKVTSREFVETDREWVCDSTRKDGTCREGHWNVSGHYEETYGPFASWQGCVEARPYPYNVNDAPASGGSNNTGIGFGDPATMFVPMFAPDEPGDRWKLNPDDRDEPSPVNYNAANNWWNDDTTGAGPVRQKNMTKYFITRPYHAPTLSKGSGPNYSCTTNPITPLTDVSTEEGLTAIKSAIDGMKPNGNTNVPEGTAWGWRTVSSSEPFTGGRLETEKGNDKVVIVLTDGANTYSVPNSDPAGNKSTYAAYGYTGVGYNGTGTTRLFMGVSGAIGPYNYSSGNYAAALNEQMATLCANAKSANLLVMTVALDLSESYADEKTQIEALRKCASDSRFRKDPTDPRKPAKLFWNASSSNLAEKFKEIADELSNLRIVG
jgi:Flp pilus assembly protein TadG